MRLVTLLILLCSFPALARAQTQPEERVHPGATHLVTAEAGVMVPLVEVDGFTHRFVATVGLRALWAVNDVAALGLRVNMHHALIPYENYDGDASLERNGEGTIEDELTVFPTLGFAFALAPAEWFAVQGAIGAGHFASTAWPLQYNFLAAVYVYPMAGLALDFTVVRSDDAELHAGVEADVLGIWWAELPLVLPRATIGVRL